MVKLFDPGLNGGKKQIQTQGVWIQSSMDAASGYSQGNGGLKEFRKPGYQLCRFVKGFMDTDSGPVPRIKTTPDREDKLSAVKVRLGIRRDDYKISPGLYGVGNPDKNSEVMVTANYKLSFDHLRTSLKKIDAWILVLDTNGVNVWCAAGKGTFSTRELVKRIKTCNLGQIVSHKRIILPQLGATGVSATEVKKRSGFTAVYGPVRAADIPKFLENNKTADKTMRQVTFTFIERLILTPVELKIVIKPALIAALIIFLISGFGPGFFSLGQLWSRGMTAFSFLVMGILAGAFFSPVFLPYIPFKAFAAKGIISGAVLGGLLLLLFSKGSMGSSALAGLFLFTVAVSSYLSMNFTGATPFTSPSGVEKEMKRFIPVQAVGVLASVVLWIYSAF